MLLRVFDRTRTNLHHAWSKTIYFLNNLNQLKKKTSISFVEIGFISAVVLFVHCPCRRPQLLITREFILMITSSFDPLKHNKFQIFSVYIIASEYGISPTVNVINFLFSKMYFLTKKKCF